MLKALRLEALLGIMDALRGLSRCNRSGLAMYTGGNKKKKETLRYQDITANALSPPQTPTGRTRESKVNWFLWAGAIMETPDS